MNSDPHRRNWLLYIPLLGQWIALRKLRDLRGKVDALDRDHRALLGSLGGDIDGLKYLIRRHGSVRTIEDLIEKSGTPAKDVELIASLEDKYGSLRAVDIRVGELEEKLRKSEQILNELNMSIGGLDSLPELRSLRDRHGSLSTISEKLNELENLRKSPSVGPIDSEDPDYSAKLRRFGRPDDIVQRLSEYDSNKSSLIRLETEREAMERDLIALKSEKERNSSHLNALLMDIGGEELIPQIKDLRSKYGALELIGGKLSEYDSNREALLRLKAERETMERDLKELRERSEGNLNRLNALLRDIGGEELIPQIKNLRSKYGTFDLMARQMEEFQRQKTQIIQINEKLSHLEAENKNLGLSLEAKDSQYQNIMQRLGGEEEVRSAEELKGLYPSFRSIKERMDSLPELEKNSQRMRELDEIIGEDTWILDQLKEKMVARRKNFLNMEEEISENFSKLGERFRNECVESIRDIFHRYDTEARYDVEKDRKDISVSFVVDGNKRFDVVIECKAIDQYYRNSPIVLVPPLRDKDLESVKTQLQKANKQLSKGEIKKLKITVISIPYERFREYGIADEVVLSESKREVERLVISQSCLKPLLLSLRVLCKSYTPELDFEKLVDTYSNPEYVDMITQIYSKIKEWEDVSDKMMRKKDTLDKEYRLFTNYYEKIRNLMMEWRSIIQIHRDKALTWTNDQKLLASSEEIVVEELDLPE